MKIHAKVEERNVAITPRVSLAEGRKSANIYVSRSMTYVRLKDVEVSIPAAALAACTPRMRACG
jgi:hypothetical protein